jgi:hypothetical protein
VSEPTRRHEPRLGRRLGDPPDRTPPPGSVAVRGRLAGVSVRATAGAGGWVGFALGLIAGSLVGAVVVWFAGAILDWQRDLAFTFGVARRLLPFGDQVGLLQAMEARWWLVVPAAALAFAILGAVIGALVGGLLAAAYNRSPRHAFVVVELPSDVAGRVVGGPSSPDGADTPEQEPAAAGRPPGDRAS